MAVNENLTIQEYSELLTFIMNNHSWNAKYTGKLSEEEKKGRRFIKYVTAHFDTRDGTVYAIELDDFFFAGSDGCSLQQLVYGFLQSDEACKDFDAYRKR